MLNFDLISQIDYCQNRRLAHVIMKSLGELLRKLRVEQKVPLRTVAAFLDIDQAILSKIETGKRSANRNQVVQLAEFFKLDKEDLLVPWLADKVVYELAHEELAFEVLQVAEERVTYYKSVDSGLSQLKSQIKEILDKDGRVASAWLFGSIMDNKQTRVSDLDIMVELNQEKKYSMFDLLDLADAIEKKISRKVDLVEKGQLKDFARKTASKKMEKIYG